MKSKMAALLIVIALSMITLAACTKDSSKIQNAANRTEQNQQVKDSINTNKTDSSVPTNETKAANKAAKIEGKKEEFLGRLDSIQKQLDVLPEKKDSDAGTTIAMRSYYGKSYDMYDKALNEIYILLKEQLSQDTVKSLEAEEIKWIGQKENAANKAASEFKGGTLEYVAYNMSLYQSTKDRCYELVNNYMTDSKIKMNASKQDYIKKLENIQNEILSSQEYKNLKFETDSSMLAYANKEYTEWDGQLNKIYNLLKQQLPSDEMKKLDKEEVQWITQKEKKAKESEAVQGTGSQLGNIAYKSSLAHTTQSRCYELVYRYMK